MERHPRRSPATARRRRRSDGDARAATSRFSGADQLQLQTVAQASPPPQSFIHCRSQAGLPPFEDPLLLLLLVDPLDDSMQRPSATCTQTPCSVWFASSWAASAQVEKMPIGQIAVPHAQTRSTTPPRIRNPQPGIACVSAGALLGPASAADDAGGGVGSAVGRGRAAVLAVRALLQVEAADGEEPSPDEREAGSSEDAHGATLRRARRWAKFLAGR